jgi:hypothetical protein
MANLGFLFDDRKFYFEQIKRIIHPNISNRIKFLLLPELFALSKLACLFFYTGFRIMKNTTFPEMESREVLPYQLQFIIRSEINMKIGNK